MKPPTLCLLLFVVFADATDFAPRCGNCWCAVGVEGGECPEFNEGLTSGFSEALADAYASNVLVTGPAELPRLSTSKDVDQACNPFASVGEIDRFPQSSLQGCAVPEVECAGSDDQQVCAFRYLTDGIVVGDTCQGREYEMITYASVQCAVADGAAATHVGPCGVCSTAQDLAVMGGKVETLARESLICSAAFYASVAFGSAAAALDSMIDCYQRIGYSRPCATLWSYSSAIHALLCENTCTTERGNNTDPDLHGPPPNCTISDCLQCTERLTAAEFDIFGGRSDENSGVVARVARACGTFAAVVHDSCAPSAPQTPSLADASCKCSRELTNLTTADISTTSTTADNESSTFEPTHHSAWAPTHHPTSPPTHHPTSPPTHNPTSPPTHNQTSPPTHNQTSPPTHKPTSQPTHNPSVRPTFAPTGGAASEGRRIELFPKMNMIVPAVLVLWSCLF